MSGSGQRRVAVVGSGVAGLTAAWVASRTSHVTLYEADARLGGHADTHRVPTPEGELAIDTGFIVHNRRTYPTLLRLFAELGVATQPSEMSLSVSDAGTGVEYAGALGPRGLFAQRSTLRSREHWRMLLEIPRFHRRARAVLAHRPCVRRGVGPDPARVPRPGRLLRRLRPPLHGAPGRGRVVLRPRDLARLPRALPLHLPPAPRHARGLRLAGVAHGDGRLAHLRRRGRGRPARRTPRHQGHLRARGRRRRRGHRRQRRHHHLRRRGHRHPPVPRARHARGADRPAARAALGAPLPSNPALLHTDTSLLPDALDARASWNFFRPAERDRRGHRDLRPDPAPAAAHRHPLPRHPRWRGPRRPRHRDRPDGVRAPALHPRVGRRVAPPAGDQHRADRLRRRLPRLGLPRGRRAIGTRRGHPPRPAVDPHHDGAARAGPLRDHDPPHPAYADPALLRAHLDLLARRPRRPARPRQAGPLRGPRPPRLAGASRCAPTSRRSSPTTA